MTRKSFMIGCVLTLLSPLTVASCQQIQLMTADAIDARLTPPGAGFVKVAAQSALAAPASAGSPEEIYKTYCFVCHDAGVAGAPKLGDTQAWAPRVAKGMDVLLDHVVNGFGVMPAKGTCATCSDEELQHTIDYMLEQNK